MLDGLGDPGDEGAWRRFDETYRPMLVRFGGHVGLDRHDAEEAAQRTMVAFCRAYRQGQYDRDKGRFRNWLLGIAKHEISGLHAERVRQPIPAGQRTSIEAAVSRLRDPESVSAVWEREWRDHVLSLCFQEARQRFSARDIRIFERLTIDRRGTDEVAEELDLTPAAVYEVKYRVLKFMREAREGMDAE